MLYLYMLFFFSSRRRHTRCALVTGGSDVCSSDLPGCDSDGSRVAFMQKGNTVFLLRDITPNPLNPSTTPQPQYVGLASEFNLLDLNLEWDTDQIGRASCRERVCHYV